MTNEEQRLQANCNHTAYWSRWGPYLSERQWGTVREDYSASGSAWEFFPHDHARSRAYRWGEDGIAGICDNHQRLCFAITLWNGEDPILKERLFGLTGNEGNHGEDVKEYFTQTMRFFFRFAIKISVNCIPKRLSAMSGKQIIKHLKIVSPVLAISFLIKNWRKLVKKL